MKEISEKLLAVFLIEHREHVTRIRALLEAPEADARVLEELLRRAHTLKGAARTVGLSPVETLAHRLESLFAQVREGALTLNQDVRAVVDRALDAMEDAVAAELENRAPDHARPTAPVQPLDAVRVRAEDLDRLLRSSTQLLVENRVASPVSRQLDQLCREARELDRARARFRAAGCTRPLEVIEEKISALATQVSVARRAHQRSAWALARLIEQLEQDISRVRMVAAEAIFDGFRKMVRDLARDEGKEIEFRIQGLELQADRLVLQALKDPVMHLLRNAVCHGIEPPQERIAADKNPAGRIVLRLAARSDRLHVSVEDDGRGIDLKVVAEVAARRGLISERAARSRTPEEVVRLILEPGVSTATSVTRLSGRGMGLSVVQEQVQRLQGEVVLRHEAGAGTCLLLSVPLSVSRHHVILVACRGQTFAVPIHGIERLCRLRGQDVQTVEGRETISFRGAATPVCRLPDLLQMPEVPARDASRVRPEVWPAFLLRSGDQCLAVVVDALLDERNAVVRDLGLKTPQTGKTAGGVLLEDGSVALVLNPAALWEAFRRLEKQSGIRPAAEPHEKRHPTILVVDDSITTRSLEKSILEAHGYRVRLAVDGMDALAQLRAEKADLVIADVLMPRLDGFGLLEQMKKDKALAAVPVIIVSSLERGQDQQRGLALGADSYIVKRKFDENELLGAVRQLI